MFLVVELLREYSDWTWTRRLSKREEDEKEEDEESSRKIREKVVSLLIQMIRELFFFHVWVACIYIGYDPTHRGVSQLLN